jgi:hypothetical protein
MSGIHKQRFRPCLEALEARCVLDSNPVYTWTPMPMPMPMPSPVVTPMPMPSPQPAPSHHSHHAHAAHQHHHGHHTVVMGAHTPAMTGMMAMGTMM